MHPVLYVRHFSEETIRRYRIVFANNVYRSNCRYRSASNKGLFRSSQRDENGAYVCLNQSSATKHLIFARCGVMTCMPTSGEKRNMNLLEVFLCNTMERTVLLDWKLLCVSRTQDQCYHCRKKKSLGNYAKYQCGWFLLCVLNLKACAGLTLFFIPHSCKSDFSFLRLFLVPTIKKQTLKENVFLADIRGNNAPGDMRDNQIF